MTRSRRALLGVDCYSVPMGATRERDLVVNDRVVIPGSDLSWSAVRASGPGGQNVNKVATKVDLRLDLEGTTALPEAVKDRLRRLAEGRLDAEGRLVVTSKATRTQTRNLEDAREKLAGLVRRALARPKPRRPTRPTRGSQKRRLESKRKRAQTKRTRGRVREDRD